MSFKNALDWLILLAERDPPYLADKPIGLVATAGAIQGLQAINSMDFIARALHAWSVPHGPARRSVVAVLRARRADE